MKKKSWFDIPATVYNKDDVRPDEYKKQFLQLIGVDLDKLYPSLFTTVEFIDLDRIIYKKEYPTYQPICVNEIIGTIHKDYGGYSLIEVFKRLIRGERHCEDIIRRKSIDPYKHLRIAATRYIKNIIKVYRINGKYYIKEGNHRVTMLRICYLTEIQKTRSPKKRAEIEKKYTFEVLVYDGKLKDTIDQIDSEREVVNA